MYAVFGIFYKKSKSFIKVDGVKNILLLCLSYSQTAIIKFNFLEVKSFNT